jgi:hypothetical protein
MTTKPQRCKSCNKILQVELVIADKLGCDSKALQICTDCIHGAVQQILAEEKEAMYKDVQSRVRFIE